MTTPARRRTRVAGAAVAALTGSLALQPMLSAPAQAGVNCGSTDILAPEMGDCEAPASVILTKPRVETVRSEATFEITTAEEDADDPDVVFECRLERGYPTYSDVVQDWTDCSVTDPALESAGRSLGLVTYSGLSPETYRFSVRATDVADDLFDPPASLGGGTNTETTRTTDNTHEWTVLAEAHDNQAPPETRITHSPKRWNLARYASVDFETDEEIETYECTLQKGSGEPEAQDCSYGQAVMYGLGAGDWEFAVSGIDYAGDRDVNPATARWSVPQGVQSMRTMKKGWKKKAGREYFLRNYAIATKKGTTFYKGIKGRKISSMVLVVTKCEGCGKIKVTRNDKKLKTIKLNAARTKHSKVVTVARWNKPKKGRFKFEVVSKGKDVIVEGLGVSTWR